MTRRRSNMQNMAQEIKEDMGVRETAATPGARKVDNVVQSYTQTPVQNPAPMNPTPVAAGEDATALLKTQDAYSSAENETSLLQPETGTVQQDGATGVLDMTQAVIGTFMIEKEIILIHAEEVI